MGIGDLIINDLNIMSRPFKKLEAFSKLLPSSSSSITDDDTGLPSLFLVVHHSNMESAYFSIIELSTPKLKLGGTTRKKKPIKKTEVIERQYGIRFKGEPRDGPSHIWFFSSPSSSTEEDLYMVPSRGFKQLPSFKFNFTTEIFLQIDPAMPPEPAKPPEPAMPTERHGHAVNLGGRMYFLAHDIYHDHKLSVFQCYDPDNKSWKPLKPFPVVLAGLVSIVATAVWRDTILFNVGNTEIWAYDVGGDRWYPVDVVDKRCCDIVGEAVVVGDTIYALTIKSFHLVLALCIDRQQLINGDLVFICSLGSVNLVRDISPIEEPWEGFNNWRLTRHLVHLSKDNFCLVQSSSIYATGFNGYQDVRLTYVKLMGKNSSVVADIVHHVKLPEEVNALFEVILCFSLSKCKTTALKEGKIFNFDLFPDEYESTPVQAEAEKDVLLDNDSSQWGDGRLIYVRLPPNATVTQLAMELQKFGPIFTDWIEVKCDIEGQRYALVEFESATSKQLAVEASPIMIGDCPTEILGKDLTGITLVDCSNSTQDVGSSSFGKNKLKKHEEEEEEEDRVSLFESVEELKIQSEINTLKKQIEALKREQEQLKRSQSTGSKKKTRNMRKMFGFSSLKKLTQTV